MNSGHNISTRRSDTILQTRREPLPWPDDRAFRILSLDGGGIKGIFPAGILAYLEENCLNGQPIGDYFDLVAGTSTGGIIALGLGAGLTARSLLDLYVNEGHRVFPPRQRQKSNRLFRRLSRNRYDRAALDELLLQTLGARTLRESRYRLLIPATEAKHGDPAVYKTPHHPGYFLDGDKPMSEVAAATSAAPTYLKPVIQDGYVLLDGGIWGQQSHHDGLGGSSDLLHSAAGENRDPECRVRTGRVPYQQQADVRGRSVPVARDHLRRHALPVPHRGEPGRAPDRSRQGHEIGTGRKARSL